MFDTIFGLPLHPLVVHATVVVVPLAAVTVVAAAVSRRFRQWAGLLPLAISLVAVVLVPISTSSGESLEHRVAHNALVEQHAHLADGLLPWAIALTVGAALLTWSSRRARDGRLFLATAALVGVVAAAGTTVQVARIGHSGAKAAWSDVASSSNQR
jgi:hypothetical protein